MARFADCRCSQLSARAALPSLGSGQLDLSQCAAMPPHHPRAPSPPVVHFNCLQWWTAIEANSYTLLLALCEVNAIWSWPPSSWHLAPFLHGSLPRRVMIRLRLASPCPRSSASSFLSKESLAAAVPLFIRLLVEANYSACWCPREFLIAKCLSPPLLAFIYWCALGTRLGSQSSFSRAHPVTSASCSIRFTCPFTCARAKVRRLGDQLKIELPACPNRPALTQHSKEPASSSICSFTSWYDKNFNY